MSAPAEPSWAFGPLGVVVARFSEIQRSMESMRACVAAGDPASIRAASDALMRLVTEAQGDGEIVRRLVEDLGASSVSEAAHILCQRGDNEQARCMMRLHALAEAITHMQVQIAALVRECLDTLDAAKASIEQRVLKGRLLGSA